MIERNSKIQKAALWYAKKGWPVLPLYGIEDCNCECRNDNCTSPGKHPRIENGVHAATTRTKLIQQWWSKWPNSNIGIRTGKELGFFVLDIDSKNNGEESISDLIFEYGKFPDTVESHTGGGGRHIFFQHPGYYVKGFVGFKSGIDIRADGNYIVAPPSLHISGKRYEFEVSSRPDEVEIAEAPYWLLNLLKNTTKTENSSSDQINDQKIPVGKRDATLTSIAGTLRNRGLNYNEILPSLIAINAQRCEPPLSENQVEKIARSICRYKPKKDLITSSPINNPRSLGIVQLSTVKSEQVEFLWYPYMPMGKLTLIDGDPGVGKSWLTLAIATSITKGNGLPDMDKFDPDKVLLMSAEDGIADTIKPRLEALKADCNLIYAVDQVFTLDDNGLVLLKDQIEEYSPKIVFIDPLFAYFGSQVDIHRANETRAIMAQLADIAEGFNCSIVGIRHLTKGGQTKAIFKGMGSIDLTAACRSVLLVGSDSNNKDMRAIVHIKSNLAPLGDAIGFKIERGEFFWTGKSNLTADRILEPESEDIASAREEAEEFLREILSGGKVYQHEIIKQAKENGISEATLKRAKKILGVRSRKEHNMEGKWYWELPAKTIQI